MNSTLRPILSLFLVLAVMGWANHCILNDAFASSKSSNQQSSPCHESGNKKEGHHKKCLESGCCQPVLKTSQTAFSNVGFLNFYAPLLFVANLIEAFETINFVTFIVPKYTTGPPGLQNHAIASLSSAPQAPPFFS